MMIDDLAIELGIEEPCDEVDIAEEQVKRVEAWMKHYSPLYTPHDKSIGGKEYISKRRTCALDGCCKEFTKKGRKKYCSRRHTHDAHNQRRREGSK